jgi:hypothetical protein
MKPAPRWRTLAPDPQTRTAAAESVDFVDARTVLMVNELPPRGH